MILFWCAQANSLTVLRATFAPTRLCLVQIHDSTAVGCRGPAESGTRSESTRAVGGFNRFSQQSQWADMIMKEFVCTERILGFEYSGYNRIHCILGVDYESDYFTTCAIR